MPDFLNSGFLSLIFMRPIVEFYSVASFILPNISYIVSFAVKLDIREIMECARD